MTFKQTMTINKAWSHDGAASFSLGAIFARLKSAVKIEIPVGYQDETGFHAGVKAEEKEIKWPTTW